MNDSSNIPQSPTSSEDNGSFLSWGRSRQSEEYISSSMQQPQQNTKEDDSAYQMPAALSSSYNTPQQPQSQSIQHAQYISRSHSQERSILSTSVTSAQSKSSSHNSNVNQSPIPFRSMPPKEFSLGNNLRRMHPLMPLPTLPGDVVTASATSGVSGVSSRSGGSGGINTGVVGGPTDGIGGLWPAKLKQQNSPSTVSRLLHQRQQQQQQQQQMPTLSTQNRGSGNANIISKESEEESSPTSSKRRSSIYSSMEESDLDMISEGSKEDKLDDSGKNNDTDIAAAEVDKAGGEDKAGVEFGRKQSYSPGELMMKESSSTESDQQPVDTATTDQTKKKGTQKRRQSIEDMRLSDRSLLVYENEHRTSKTSMSIDSYPIKSSLSSSPEKSSSSESGGNVGIGKLTTVLSGDTSYETPDKMKNTLLPEKRSLKQEGIDNEDSQDDAPSRKIAATKSEAEDDIQFDTLAAIPSTLTNVKSPDMSISPITPHPRNQPQLHIWPTIF